MKTEFILHVEHRSGAKGFINIFDNLSDAEFAVKQLEDLNTSLSYSGKFYGFVTKWQGYSLDDGSKVTVDEIPIIVF